MSLKKVLANRKGSNFDRSEMNMAGVDSVFPPGTHMAGRVVTRFTLTCVSGAQRQRK